jgi:glycosyltransferase involved in cell wall biosynthesis
MPIYNGGSGIASKITVAIRKFESQFSSDFELIVVDDGSNDGTLQKLRNRIGNERVKIVGYRTNKGKGGALTFGFGFCTAENIIFADGDIQALPSNILEYFDALKTADIVVASKRVGGAVVTASVKRNFLSLGFNLFVRLLLSLSLTDTQVGFKVFRRSALEKILPLISVKRYAFDVELLVVAMKVCHFKIVELRAEVTLVSNFKMKNIVRMVIDLLGIAYRLKLKHWYQDNLVVESVSPYQPILRW